MANLREAYAVAASQSLKWNDDYERAIDRIAAAGRCPAVGCALYRARYALDALSYQSARKALMRHYAARYPSEMKEIALSVVEQALHEHLSPSCETCLGAGQVVVGNLDPSRDSSREMLESHSRELKTTCPECMGHRVRRYSDSERSRMMKLSFERVRKLDHKINWLLGEMGNWERKVNAILNDELERFAFLK